LQCGEGFPSRAARYQEDFGKLFIKAAGIIEGLTDRFRKMEESKNESE